MLRLPFLDGGWGELLKRRWPSAESIPWQEYVWHTWHQPEDPAWKSRDDMPWGYWRGISYTTCHANTLRNVTQASGTRDHSQCSDGKKLEPGQRCDGVNDCAGGEDEINCHEVNLWRHISVFQINPSSHMAFHQPIRAGYLLNNFESFMLFTHSFLKLVIISGLNFLWIFTQFDFVSYVKKNNFL